MLKVFDKCCKNCLYSADSIVSPERRKQITKDAVAEQSYFICHKASMKGEEVVCKKFYGTLGHTSQMIRIAGRLNAIEFVEQSDDEKLITYKEMNL